jgi:quercetin dioxygenase-like cupin family protein
MIIKKLSDVPYAVLQGYENVKKQIVIGPADGSDEIIMRYFTLGQNGSSPYHSHDWPHLVRIEKGSGVLMKADQQALPVAAGDYVFVESNAMHCFQNTGDTPLSFMCIVPARGES